MGTEELERRLAELEHRLASIEKRLAEPEVPPGSPLLIIQPPYAAKAAAIAEGYVQSVSEVKPEATEGTPRANEQKIVSHLQPPPLPTQVVTPLNYQTHSQQAPRRRTNLEQAIGLRWAGWIGAIVLVIGGALAVKFAYDQGWWQGVPPQFRLVMMSLGGVILLAAGEWVYRRINVVAAASLFGAGIAIFFLVSYAGNAFYGLYSRDSAFMLMAVSTLIGAAVAMRGDMVSIAVLALIGGNVAPLVLTADHPHIPSFFGYLLMLQIVALFLAWHGTHGKWWTLRAVSLGTNSLWVAAILNDGRNLPATAVLLGFFVIFALLYHIELILSAARGNDLLGKYGGSFAMLITAGFMAAVLYVEWNAAPGIRGAWVLGACAATALTGALLRLGNADALLRRLSPSYWLQAGALLVLAVPMMFKGVDVPLGWGAMALTFAVYGAVVKLPSARSFALLCWSLSLMALLWYATDGGHDFINGTEGRGPVVWLHIGGTAFRNYTIIAWLLALAGHVIASLNGRRFESTTAPPDNNLDPLLMRVAIVADAVWAAAAVAALEPLGATLALAVFAWLAAVAAGLDRRGNWAVHSMGMLVVAVIKWSLVDMLIGFWSAPTASIWALHYTPVLNPLMGMGLLLSVSMVVEFWIFRRRLWDFLIRWTGPELDGRRSFLLCAAVVIAIVTFGLSFEIERVVELALMRGSPMIWPPGQLKQMGWTILWTLAVSVFVGLAFFVESPEQRSGWVRTIARMPLFLAAKFLLIDTLVFRVIDGAALATVGANLQMVTALVVVGGLALAWYVGRWPDESGVPGTRLQFGSAVLAALVLLWCGTLEIDRAYERLAGAAGMGVRAELAKQVAWSIYWSLFATGAIAAGFHGRSSAVRYFGLGLFGLTLLKVVLVDMSQVGRGYRIFSFMVLGLLLLGTSVLYGKLTPRLLGKVSEES